MPEIRFQVPQAYRDLGISYFLHLSPVAEEDLKKHHVRETRRLHPDLLAIDTSDEERELAEAQLAALNSAFLRLRETPVRLDMTLEQILENNPQLKHSEKPQLPRELAMEYFELQEALEEKPGDPETREAIGRFHNQVRIETLDLGRQIENFIASTPIERYGDKELGAPTEAILSLIKLRNRERYLRSLQNDLENKLA